MRSAINNAVRVRPGRKAVCLVQLHVFMHLFTRHKGDELARTGMRGPAGLTPAERHILPVHENPEHAVPDLATIAGADFVQVDVLLRDIDKVQHGMEVFALSRHRKLSRHRNHDHGGCQHGSRLALRAGGKAPLALDPVMVHYPRR